MLIVFNTKQGPQNTTRSARPSSSRPNKSNLAMEVPHQRHIVPHTHHNAPNSMRRSNNLGARTTDDMVCVARPQQANAFGGCAGVQQGMFNPIDAMFGMMGLGSFSNGGTPVSRRQVPSKVISQTYVYSTNMDNNGRMYAEKYFSNDYAMRGADGTTLLERQQAYHNTGNNLQRIAEERRINNKGKKVIQQRIKGQDNHHARQEIFYDMDQDEIQGFDNQWKSRAGHMGFYCDFGKMIGNNHQDTPVNIRKTPSNAKKASTNVRKTPSNARKVPSNNNFALRDAERERETEDIFYPQQRTQDFSSGMRESTQSSQSSQRDLPSGRRNVQEFARVRRNDIQPTPTSDRAIALPSHEPVHSNVQRNRPQTRAVRVQHRPQTPPEEETYEPVHAPVREQNRPQTRAQNRPQTREHNPEVQPTMNANVKRDSVRSDGNFKNKNIQMTMPEAG